MIGTALVGIHSFPFQLQFNTILTPNTYQSDFSILLYILYYHLDFLTKLLSDTGSLLYREEMMSNPTMTIRCILFCSYFIFEILFPLTKTKYDETLFLSS
jgi:hypothetical protein